MAKPGLMVSDLDAEGCWRRLRSAQVGRIGITLGALPVILPVFFGVVDGSIVFRTGRGAKLSAATEEAVVAFEVDEYLPDGGGWSVVVQGIAAEVTAPERLARLQGVRLPRVADGERHDRVVAITPSLVTGRVLGPAGRDAADPDTAPGGPGRPGSEAARPGDGQQPSPLSSR